jgi:hypothetical protein
MTPPPMGGMGSMPPPPPSPQFGGPPPQGYGGGYAGPPPHSPMSPFPHSPHMHHPPSPFQHHPHASQQPWPPPHSPHSPNPYGQQPHRGGPPPGPSYGGSSHGHPLHPPPSPFAGHGRAGLSPSPHHLRPNSPLPPTSPVPQMMPGHHYPHPQPPHLQHNPTLDQIWITGQFLGVQRARGMLDQIAGHKIRVRPLAPSACRARATRSRS